MSGFHPEPGLLLSFNAGSLSIAQALAVRVHLSFCRQCRQQQRQLDQLGGSLLEQITPASLEDSAFETLMAKLEAPADSAAESAPSEAAGAAGKILGAPPVGTTTRDTKTLGTKGPGNSGNPLLKYLPTSLEQLPWQRQTSSIFKFDLSSIIDIPGYQVVLQKISAGAKVPTHTHRGLEYTVVLSGGFSDEMGVYHRGDFIARDPSHKHTPTALQNEDCICLTVLGAPLKFTGWQRIFNPFIAWH